MRGRACLVLVLAGIAGILMVPLGAIGRGRFLGSFEVKPHVVPEW